jgi:hypothetical protein
MTRDLSGLVVGDEWVYRLRDDSPSERVRILAVMPTKRSARVDVVFLDDPAERVERDVPGGRLRVPWSEVAAFDVRMANWRRVDNLELDLTEQACAEEIFILFIDAEVAELLWSPVSCATRVRDQARLDELMGVPAEQIIAGVEWFDDGAEIIVAPAGTLLIAEAICRADPMPVLDMVVKQETEARHKCKHGSKNGSLLGKEPTSPEWEYDWYRRHDRPRHELLRQWCGHRAVTVQERLLAAEAENQRLDVLVTDLIKALEHADEKRLAAHFAEEHERDRITPYKVRPVADRPLHPSEIPVREVRVRRRWGH